MGQKTVRFSDLSGQLILEDDALARIVVQEHPELVDGPVEIEAYTVMHGRDAPERALLACLLPDGRRAWGYSTEADTMTAMTKEEFIGRRAHLARSGVVTVE